MFFKKTSNKTYKANKRVKSSKMIKKKKKKGIRVTSQGLKGP